MTTRSESRTDKLQAARERLTQAVEAIVSGDDWKRMLKVSAKFHRYSFSSQLLIFLQRPARLSSPASAAGRSSGDRSARVRMELRSWRPVGTAPRSTMNRATSRPCRVWRFSRRLRLRRVADRRRADQGPGRGTAEDP